MNNITIKIPEETYKLLDLISVLMEARESLKFYGDIKYSHTWGVSPDAQFIAEAMIKKIDRILEECLSLS